MHPCERCGEPIADQYRLCYICYVTQDERKPAYNAQTPQKVVYPSPTVVCAPNAQEMRQKAIQDAHEENIIASTQLTEAIRELAGQIANFRDEFRQRR